MARDLAAVSVCIFAVASSAVGCSSGGGGDDRTARTTDHLQTARSYLCVPPWSNIEAYGGVDNGTNAAVDNQQLVVQSDGSSVSGSDLVTYANNTTWRYASRDATSITYGTYPNTLAIPLTALSGVNFFTADFMDFNLGPYQMLCTPL
jgi:hypothetical protein